MLEKAVALAILAAVYAALVTNRVPRTTAVVAGAVAMVGAVGLTETMIVRSIHWEALGLLFGMFIIVAALGDSGFFRWVGLHVLRAAGFRPLRVFLAFAALAAGLAAFLDSITVLLFLGSLTLEVTRILRVPPAPFLVAEITSANIGGAATMVGDPPNIVLGTALDLGFVDFVVHVGPLAALAFAINLGLLLLAQRRHLAGGPVDPRALAARHREFDPFAAVTDLRLLRVALLAFAVTTTLLVLHQVLDLLVAFVGILGATMVLLLGGRGTARLVEAIDWSTIVFLAGLFVIVGGLGATGVLADGAALLGGAAGGNPVLLVTLLLWSSALLSSLLDNIPYAAAMIPLLQGLSAATGIPVATLAWTLAAGNNFGGNATPIGASANVVGLSLAQRASVEIRWRDYTRLALPGVLLSVAASNALIVLRYLR